MIKRLLLLLCLLVTAGSAAWAEIASGKWNNGHWSISDEGELYVNVNHVSSDFKMPDWGEGKAPIRKNRPNPLAVSWKKRTFANRLMQTKGEYGKKRLSTVYRCRV